MKKFVSLLTALCLFIAAPAALAEPDKPFDPDVDYTVRYTDYGCIPSMLNFGYAQLSDGESFYEASTTTVKQASAAELQESLGEKDYYIYAKWQNAAAVGYGYIDAMLVMTDPDGDCYVTYDEWEQYDLPRRVVCSWFFGVSDLLKRSAGDNQGTLAAGEYTFTLYFNNQLFRTNTVSLN